MFLISFYDQAHTLLRQPRLPQHLPRAAGNKNTGDCRNQECAYRRYWGTHTGQPADYHHAGRHSQIACQQYCPYYLRQHPPSGGFVIKSRWQYPAEPHLPGADRGIRTTEETTLAANHHFQNTEPGCNTGDARPFRQPL